MNKIAYRDRPSKRQKKLSPAIIFDIGNVLLDWNPRYLYRKLFDGDEEAVEQFLIMIGFKGWNLQQDAGRSFSEAVEELCGLFPEYCKLIHAYHERYEETIAGPIQGSVEIMKALREQGYSLYALSNWSVEKFALVRPKYEFFNWFRSIIISGEVKLVKPDARIFQLLLKKINRRADDCLLIDDSTKNIAAAKELGFQTILFQSPEQLRTELRQRGIGALV